MKRKPVTAAPDLKADTVAILLAGWGAHAPEPSPHGFGGGVFALTEPHHAGFLRLWRDHESWLRQKAQAWGWTPEVTGPDGVRRFWAEHLAAGYPEPQFLTHHAD